ncbi:gephyrin-like molybdotransferase Glp [Bradymonas sediminis]|nr:gephyrin-like molybdotransferase Glp [Bradymonas sediminis]TDP76081.1 molybdopterin molybdochelatase [Bradymonas sediminis]
MIDVAHALDLFDSNISALATRTVSLDAALGRVAAKDVLSKIDLPPFSQSAMDGYAVRAEDLGDASEQAPVCLTRVGEVAAGAAGELAHIGKGETVRIFTGARIPPGADAVVRQEDTMSQGGAVYFKTSVPPAHDIRGRGEELREGTRLIAAGERLDARHIGVLSMCGHAEVEVYREPRITLLISGDEIASAGRPLGPGEVYDANRPFLAGWLRMRGYANVRIVALADEREAVATALAEAFAASDLVISTGGVSVGEYDFFTHAAEAMGLETVFWRVRQRPGKPLLFARRDECILLGIPGNPGAVFVSAYVYLRRVLDRLEGRSEPGPRMRGGVLGEAVGCCARRVTWCGCQLDYDGRGVARLLPVGGHKMTQLYRADAIALIPPAEAQLPPGSVVRWFSLH